MMEMNAASGVMVSDLGKQAIVSLILTGCSILLALCLTNLSK